MYGRFAEVACNSEGTAKEFVRWLPKMQPRTCVTPNGVPVEKFGVAEVVGDAGVLVNPGDHAQLARELRDVLSNPTRRKTLEEASQRRASDFGIERTVDGYLRIYEAALADLPA